MAGTIEVIDQAHRSSGGPKREPSSIASPSCKKFFNRVCPVSDTWPRRRSSKRSVSRCIIEVIHTTQEQFWFAAVLCLLLGERNLAEAQMNGLIYLIGLIVVIMAILSFFGLR
jgi:hypothetical protein